MTNFIFIQNYNNNNVTIANDGTSNADLSATTSETEDCTDMTGDYLEWAEDAASAALDAIHLVNDIVFSSQDSPEGYE